MDGKHQNGRLKIFIVTVIMLIISAVNILVDYFYNQAHEQIYILVRSGVILTLCVLIFLGYKWAKTIIEWLIAIPTVILLIGIVHVFDNLPKGFISVLFLIIYGFCIFLLANNDVEEYVESKIQLRKVVHPR